MPRRMIRQGDVLLIEVDCIPENAIEVEREDGNVVIAHGEVTGHTHHFKEDTVTQLSHGIARYLNAPEGATLVHEEHSPLEIPAGFYEIRHQREYTPKEIVRVRD